MLYGQFEKSESCLAALNMDVCLKRLCFCLLKTRQRVKILLYYEKFCPFEGKNSK